MSSDHPLSVVFAGFKATGKTTFLVSLWHTVLSPDVPGALFLEKVYEGDRDYINKRHSEWLAYEEVKRTQVDYDTPIRMTLRDRELDKLLQLGIPDLSGETFKIQFEERRASPTLVAAIRSAAGLAIFINPKEVKDPTKIRDALDAVDEEEGSSAEPGQEPTATEQGQEPAPRPMSEHSREPADDFNASLCCTQVKYVDLLQQLVEHGPTRPLRCAIIVSAMDTLDDTEFKDRPEHFIRINLSLLDQYLRANRTLFDARVYGVSAQGGKYDAATIETLARLGAHRIRVCSEGRRDHNISRPVRWLAFGVE